MASPDHSDRSNPLRRPKNWKPTIPRSTLRLPEDVTHIYTLYLGAQSHYGHIGDTTKAEELVEKWLEESTDRPPVVDTFRATQGFDIPNTRVWVAYWTNENAFRARLDSLNLKTMWQDLGGHKGHVGLWAEHFATPLERLETNYLLQFHRPGAAGLPGGEYVPHGLTGYWGAARDRIPASATDLFHCSVDKSYPSVSEVPKGVGEHLKGTSYDDMCHIRSGQHWVKCDETERRAYEEDLEPTLLEGMRYLCEHAEETGTIGLRFLYNLDERGKKTRESCGAGFFRNLQDLEMWSSRHPSHLAIFTGSLKHGERFGEERKFMTWHEVSILKQGEAGFEYVNCKPETGVMKWVRMEREAL